jgi:hypothetical protein
MCKRHDQETEKTPNETEIKRIAKGATSQNHENGQEHQDLELATLRRLLAYGLSKPAHVDGRLRHRHRVRSGCHRCGFVPKEWKKA